MAITSASTTPDIAAAFEDASDYDLVNSIEKARTFIKTGRMLLTRRPEESGFTGARLKRRVESVEQMVASAEAWLTAQPKNTAAAHTTRADLSEYRE